MFSSHVCQVPTAFSTLCFFLLPFSFRCQDPPLDVLPFFPLPFRREASEKGDLGLIAHEGLESASRTRVLYPSTARRRS